MRDPIFVEPGDRTHALGVVVPDLPGCWSAGDTRDEALDNPREVVPTWLEPSSTMAGASLHRRQSTRLKAFKGWIPSVGEIDLADVLGESERIVTSLRSAFCRLDAQAEKGNIDRSAWIAKLTLERRTDRRRLAPDADLS